VVLRGLSALVVLLTLVTQGCREEEQDRPLVHDKGVYQGAVDQKLDQEQLDALRQRATKQQM
jgi:outer membrane protein assembly factor BamE (lipoprotein component of BamABCDE complex)